MTKNALLHKSTFRPSRVRSVDHRVGIVWHGSCPFLEASCGMTKTWTFGQCSAKNSHARVTAGPQELFQISSKITQIKTGRSTRSYTLASTFPNSISTFGRNTNRQAIAACLFVSKAATDPKSCQKQTAHEARMLHLNASNVRQIAALGRR